MKIFQRFPYISLFFLCFIFYSLTIFRLPVTDRDEGRFVQATKQMIETNDYLTIKFQNEFRNKKPAGIYWLQAGFVKFFQQDLNDVWVYRVPSLIFAILSVLLTYFIASKLFNPNISMLSALFMASSPILMAEASIAKTDAMLLFCTLSVMGLLALGYKNTLKNLTHSILLGTALAAGIMCKGLLTPFFFFLTILGLLALDRERAWLKNFYWSIIILIPTAIVTPWFILIQKATNGQFIEGSLKQDFFQKIISIQESHGAPPGFYFISLFIGLWSAALWLYPSLKHSWTERKQNKSLIFCWSTLLFSWPILEFVPTKLIHYPLPLYPWICMIIAWGFSQKIDLIKSKTYLITRYIWSILSFLIAISLLVVAFKTSGVSLALFYTSSISIILISSIFLANNSKYLKPERMTLISFLIFFILLSFVLPNLSSIWVTEKIYAVLDKNLQNQPPILLMGYNEPSSVFRLGSNIVMSDNSQTLADFISINQHGHIFIDESIAKKYNNIIIANESELHKKEVISGISYNNMKQLNLIHYTLDRPHKN